MRNASLFASFCSFRDVSRNTMSDNVNNDTDFLNSLSIGASGGPTSIEGKFLLQPVSYVAAFVKPIDEVSKKSLLEKKDI